MNPVLLKIISGIVATFGFALLFRLKPRHWAYATLDGAIACIFYFTFAEIFPDNAFVPNLIASFACAFGAEIIARICKAPTTVFLLPACIALVPGGTLYYTMNNLISQNYTEAAHFLLITVEVGIAIGGGIIVASILRMAIFKFVERLKSKF